MTTPQDTIESFLQEQAAAYAEAKRRLQPLYSRCFGGPLTSRIDYFLPRDAYLHLHSTGVPDPGLLSGCADESRITFPSNCLV